MPDGRLPATAKGRNGSSLAVPMNGDIDAPVPIIESDQEGSCVGNDGDLLHPGVDPVGSVAGQEGMVTAPAIP